MLERQRNTNICIIDLETAGLTPDSVIFTMGAVRFNLADSFEDFHDKIGSDKLYLYLDPKTQKKMNGRTEDEKTMYEWWPKQSAKAHAEILNCFKPNEVSVVTLPDALKQLQDFVQPGDIVYARGQEFERDILTHAYKQFGGKFFRYFNRIFDVRSNIQAHMDSVDGFVDLPKDIVDRYTKHISIDDCILDAYQMYYVRNCPELLR